MSVVVSLSDWPLVVVSFRPGNLNDDVATLLGQLSQILQRQAHYASALDTTNINGVPDARMRQIIAHWVRDNQSALRRWNRGDALYMPSTLIRGAMTAIDWVTPPPCPRHYAASMEEAKAWCRQQLAGVSPRERAS